MDISIVISSATQNMDGLLYPAIQNIIAGCPLDFELIVVSPFDIPREFPNVKYVKDEERRGCGCGFNLGIKQSKGDYVAIAPDDFHLTGGWWGIVDFMKSRNAKYGAFINGSMAGITYAHLPCVHRSLLEGNTMRGMMYNETLFHQFLDNDLGFRLHFLEGISASLFGNGHWVYDGNEADASKWNSKMKYLKLDGVIFHKIWGRKHNLSQCYLHHQSVYTPEEIRDLAQKQLDNDPYKDLYDKIPNIESDWIPTTHPTAIDGIQEREKELFRSLR